MWVGIAETDDVTDRDLVVFEVVEETTAVGARIERPADRVDDLAGLMLGGIDFPQFLDCLLYTSPSPRDGLLSRMPSSA